MTYDVMILGGGIVGLATAYQLLRNFPQRRLLLLEKEPAVAMHQSGRNSGVIHSGVYYRPGSFKAKLCRQGYQKLTVFCRDNDVPHDICGKLILATRDEELPRLNVLMERAGANGLKGFRLVSQTEIRDIEPHAAGLAGLYIAETGIVNYRVVSEKLADHIRRYGGHILCGERVERIISGTGTKTVVTPRGEFTGRFLINCTGLFSDRIARMDGLRTDAVMVPFRGEFYQLRPEATHLVKHLIYPVPDPAFPFLGVHFTRRIDGSVECGPNAVLAFKREGYHKRNVSLRDLAEIIGHRGFRKFAARHWRTGLYELYRSFSKNAFTRALQRLVPAVRADMLVPARSGVRAQALGSDGALIDDFLFVEGQRSLHVLNAPSPAATASLAIAEEILKRGPLPG